jgi:hypothetical protein
VAESRRWERGLCVQFSGAGHAGCSGHHCGVTRAIPLFLASKKVENVCFYQNDASHQFANALATPRTRTPLPSYCGWDVRLGFSFRACIYLRESASASPPPVLVLILAAYAFSLN